jgi:hypothetical protein
MSFEIIQLPDFLLVDLYKDCLVELDNFEPDGQVLPVKSIEQPTYKGEVSEQKRIRYLGENKKHVSIIVKNEEATFIAQEDLQFLTNVLKACNLTLGDIAIINIDKQTVHFEQLAEELQPHQVLLLDVDPINIHLPFSIPDFQTINYSGTTYLKAPALVSINQPEEEARLLKTKLWVNLQKIFGIVK